VRWIELDGAVNVRDLGGLPTLDGGRIGRQRLLRADNLQGLSPADVSRLVDEVGLSTVVDLRSTTEVDSEGPGPLTAVPAVTHVHHSVLPEAGAATDVTADALAARRDRIRNRIPGEVMGSVYLGYLEDRPESVVGALRAVTAAPRAAVVHCAAGKDRTGVVVALALSAAGVERDAVVDDYTATAERIEAVLARLRASPTYAGDVDRVPLAAHTPRPRSMAVFLDELDRHHGGPVGWLARHGFGAKEVGRLRAKLVADG
jgi:protein-tyrosine phosphatase